MGCTASTAVTAEEPVTDATKQSQSQSKPVSNSSKSSNHSGGAKPEALSSSSVIPLPTPPLLSSSHDFDSDPPLEFTFEQLLEATDKFSDMFVIGEGGFGKVYQGWLLEKTSEKSTRRQVAVKKLNPEGLQGFNEWLTEVIFLRRLRHPHLVTLVGYCTEGGEGLLVYEYMPKGSLDTHLFSSDPRRSLSWDQRIKIALGAAKGLAYLHEGTERQVIFRDFKAGNILLGHDFTSKLSDFGLAKDGPQGDMTHVSTKVVGTYGYTAPEYMQTGHLTAKSDVYAFGVVLLELMSGRRAVDMSLPWEERSLIYWAKPFLSDKRKLGQFMDPKLEGRYPMKAAQKLAVTAHCCLLEAKNRPSMTEMVQTLENLQHKFEEGGSGNLDGHYRNSRSRDGLEGASFGESSPSPNTHGSARSRNRRSRGSDDLRGLQTSVDGSGDFS